MSIEAMKQTFDFLHDLWEMKQTARSDQHKKVMWELDRAIGKAEKNEPVGFNGLTELETAQTMSVSGLSKREWVGLTEEDIHQLRREGHHYLSERDFRAIEAKLREKNAYGWQSVANPTEYLDDLRGGADLCGND